MIKAQVAPADFSGLAEKLHEATGIALSGNKGTIEKSGVTATYAYDGVGELQIEVVKKPLLFRKAYCEERLKEALEEHGVTCTLAG